MRAISRDNNVHIRKKYQPQTIYTEMNWNHLLQLRYYSISMFIDA